MGRRAMFFWLATGALATPLQAATLVVLNKAEATASLIDLDDGQVRATLPTGEGPHEAAVSPDGRLALAANYGHREAPGASLTLIDVASAQVTGTIDLGDYRRPHGVQWLADGRRAVVTAEAQRALLVVDVAAGRVTRAVATDQEISHMVAVTPDGKRAFVTSIGSGSLTAIDLAAGRAVAQIPTGGGAEGVDVTPDGKEVWVTNRADDTLSVLAADSLELLATLKCAEFPIRARVTPDGRHVLVSNARSGDLAVFETATRRELRRIPFAGQAGETRGRLFGDRFGKSPVPIGIVVEPDGRRAYVAHANADAIAVIDLRRWEVVGHLEAGREPDGMAYSPRAVTPAGP